MDKQELLRRFEYSALAYSNVCETDEERVFIDSGPIGVQYLVQKKDNELYVSFRGTDELRDALTHIQFWKKVIPYGNGKSKIRVHTGFLKAYKCDEVRKTIWEFVDESINKVVLVGHSYGAALAVLCAVDLQYNFGGRDYEVALFGCPRVGNKAFVKSYNERIFKTLRIENGNDIVTKVPFRIMGYRHVGTKIHIGFLRIFGVFSIRDHSLQSYYEHLLKIL